MDGSLESGPRVSFKVEKIIGVSSDRNLRTYQVQWAPAWVSGCHLVGCEHLIQEFFQEQQEKERELSKGTSEVDSVLQFEMPCTAATTVNAPHDEESEGIPNVHRLVEYSAGSARESFQGSRLEEEQFQHGDHYSGTHYGDCDVDHVKEENKVDNLDLNADTATIKIEDNDDEEGIVTETNDYEFTYAVSFTSNNTSTSHPSETLETQGHTNQVEPHNYTMHMSQPNSSPVSPARTVEKSRNHTCTVCGREFTSRSNLKVHLRLHRGDKPFKCPHCGKSFTQSGNFNRHLRAHSGIKPYKCTQCHMSFAKKVTLANHLAMHDLDASQELG